MKIITPLKVKNREELEKALLLVNGRADIIELWLDVWEDPLGTLPLCRDIFESGSFLAVCKSEPEKGIWDQSPVEKELVLQCFLDSGGRWVDLDIIHNPESLIHSFEGASLILSWHDFESVPADLGEFVFRFGEFEADVYKWALTPSSESDLNRIIEVAKETDKPFIFTTMGTLGSEGREKLKPYTWGGFFALDKSSVTASGQKTLGDV